MLHITLQSIILKQTNVDSILSVFSFSFFFLVKNPLIYSKTNVPFLMHSSIDFFLISSTLLKTELLKYADLVFYFLQVP